MATERETEYDRDVVPAAQRINGTVPDRRHKNGTPVKVSMEDTAFSKSDGAYQNGLLGDHAVLMNSIKDLQLQTIKLLGGTATAAAVTALGGKIEALAALLDAREGADLDASAVAAQILELLPDDLAEDVVAALARQLTPAPKGATA